MTSICPKCGHDTAEDAVFVDAKTGKRVNGGRGIAAGMARAMGHGTNMEFNCSRCGHNFPGGSG